MLNTIRDKVAAGRRLSAEEGLLLYRSEIDPHELGELADAVRRRKCGDAVYYNVNAHVNPTNVCIYRCELCAYSCDPGRSPGVPDERAGDAGSSGRGGRRRGPPNCTSSAEYTPKKDTTGT